MDNAFERARAAYGTGAYDDATLEFLFPQLKESEDERIIKTLQEYVKNRNWMLNGPTQKDCLAWLEKQKDHFRIVTKMVEQKSAEWSEEDTEMYINVASSLRGYACGLENEEHKRHIKKELDWLENRFQSLRPSWKPSEEQMNALKEAYESYDFCDGERNALESLHEQLKQL